jgi:hypothetical protein
MRRLIPFLWLVVALTLHANYMASTDKSSGTRPRAAEILVEAVTAQMDGSCVMVYDSPCVSASCPSFEVQFCIQSEAAATSAHGEFEGTPTGA